MTSTMQQQQPQHAAPTSRPTNGSTPRQPAALPSSSQLHPSPFSTSTAQQPPSGGGALPAFSGAMYAPQSSFSTYVSRLSGRVQAVFSASSELLLADDTPTTRLFNALDDLYLASDACLLYLMDVDGLLTLYESEPYQSSLPLAMSSTSPAYHTHPIVLMQQQHAAMRKMRHKHDLLTAVSADYTVQRPAAAAADALSPFSAFPLHAGSVPSPASAHDAFDNGKADRETDDDDNAQPAQLAAMDVDAATPSSTHSQPHH